MLVQGKPGFSATTRNVQAIYPFQSELGFGAAGPYIGESRLGGAFTYDPWELYAAGHLTNPNMMIMGEIGSGKSALVKTLIWRSMVFKNRRALIVDPKGEYGPLTRALGAEPIALKPGGAVRLNPLDPGSGDEDSKRAQMRMLEAVIAAVLERPLTQIEHQASIEALRSVQGDKDEPTIRDVTDKLLAPTPAMATALNMTKPRLQSGAQDAGLALRRLSEGHLRGMFDGPSTENIDFTKKAVTLDLSAVYGNTAIGIFMACAFGWLAAAIAKQRETNTVIKNTRLYDESWKIFALHGFADMLQDDMKIARSKGMANILVMHRPGDLMAAGDAGSRTERLVTGFMEDTGTHVIYRQADGAGELLKRHYKVTQTELALIRSSTRGTALWKVGDRRFIVKHRLSPIIEPALVDTDQQMYQHDLDEELTAA